MESVAMSDLKSRLSEYLSRAAAGETFLIRRRQRELAALISVEELDRLRRTSRAARKLALALGQSTEVVEESEAGRIHPARAAHGLWRDDPDLEDLADRIAEGRRRSPRREVVLP